MPSTIGPGVTAGRLADTFGTRPFQLAAAAPMAGVTREQIRAAVARGLVVRLRHGEYVVAGVGEVLPPALALRASPNHLVDLRAVLGSVQGGVASHESAAILHGLPLLNRPRQPAANVVPHITIPGSTNAKATGFWVCGSRLPHRDVVEIDGIPVTSLARTGLDLARSHRIPEALAFVDAAARALIARDLGVDPHWADLRTAVREPERRVEASHKLWVAAGAMRRYRGMKVANGVIERADPAAESVLESISRAMMIKARLPLPELGCPISGPDGQTWWADGCWWEERVIGEADGMAKYQERDDLLREKRRADALAAMGWTVVRWTWDDVIHHPEATVARIAQALSNGPRPPRP